MLLLNDLPRPDDVPHNRHNSKTTTIHSSSVTMPVCDLYNLSLIASHNQLAVLKHMQTHVRCDCRHILLNTHENIFKVTIPAVGIIENFKNVSTLPVKKIPATRNITVVVPTPLPPPPPLLLHFHPLRQPKPAGRCLDIIDAYTDSETNSCQHWDPQHPRTLYDRYKKTLDSVMHARTFICISLDYTVDVCKCFQHLPGL